MLPKLTAPPEAAHSLLRTKGFSTRRVGVALGDPLATCGDLHTSVDQQACLPGETVG